MKNMLITATIVGAAIAGIILFIVNRKKVLPAMHAGQRKLNKQHAKRWVM